MHVLNKTSYRTWTAIPDAGARYLVRRWLDGLSYSTHPAWSFSPFGLSALADLRTLFLRKPGEPDWGRYQRDAIDKLALRVIASAGDQIIKAKSVNEDFWSAIPLIRPTYREAAFTAIRSYLTDNKLDYDAIDNASEFVIAELMYDGVSDLEIFNRMGTGVIDSQNLRTGTTLERLTGLLGHLESGPVYEFIATTPLLKDNTNLSRALAQALSKRRPGFDEVEIVSAGEATAIRTRGLWTHSKTAFVWHRIDVSRFLRVACAALRVNVTLVPTTTVSGPNGDVWIEHTPVTSVWQKLPKPDPAIEPAAYGRATSTAADDPEDAICALSDAFERRLGAAWVSLAATSYRRSIRAVLVRELAVAMKETENRWRTSPDSPPWLELYKRKGGTISAEVAARLREHGPHSDELLARRIDSLGSRFVPHATFVSQYLTIARGIRNASIHGGEVLGTTRSTLTYLARVMLAAFAAAFPPPKPIRKPAAA